MTTVVVDADACPRGAMDTLRRLRSELGYRLVTVASFNHNLQSEEGVLEHVTVGDGPDEADLAVVNRVRAGDLVVTQDWGLAALVLARGGNAISPKGTRYHPNGIDFLLDERHLKAKHRRGGGRTRGPKARTPHDEAAFESGLRRCLMLKPLVHDVDQEGDIEPDNRSGDGDERGIE